MVSCIHLFFLFLIFCINSNCSLGVFLEISEQNVCLEYLTDGSLFPYGCDKDDKIMLVFKCRMHVKGQKNFDELKRCLIYWFERLER